LQCEWHATALGVACLTLVARPVAATSVVARTWPSSRIEGPGAPRRRRGRVRMLARSGRIARWTGRDWRRGSPGRRTSGTAKRPPGRPDGRRARGPTAARPRARHSLRTDRSPPRLAPPILV